VWNVWCYFCLELCFSFQWGENFPHDITCAFPQLWTKWGARKNVTYFTRMDVAADQDMWRLWKESGFHPFHVDFSWDGKHNDHMLVVMLLRESLYILLWLVVLCYCCASFHISGIHLALLFWILIIKFDNFINKFDK
jgi:hypothetical protein